MEILYGNQPQTYSDTFSSSFSSSGMRVDRFNEQSKTQPSDGILSSPIKKEGVVKDYTLDDSFSFNYTKPEPIDNEFVANGTETSNEEVIIENTPTTENKVSDFLKSITEPQPVVEKPAVEDAPQVVVEEDNTEYAKKLIENMPINYKYKKPPVSIFKTVDNTQNNFEFELFKAVTKAKILTSL